MSTTTLVLLTILEVVVLLAVLVVYLILLIERLRSISSSLSKVAWGVRAVEVEVGNVGPSVLRINAVLRELTEELLPAVAERATDLAERTETDRTTVEAD